MGTVAGLREIAISMRQIPTFPCCPADAFAPGARFVLPPCRACKGAAVKLPPCAVSSQACLGATLLRSPEILSSRRAVMDEHALLFLSTYGVERGELDLDDRLRIRYKPSGNAPCVVHFNGAQKIIDYQLGGAEPPVRSRATWVPHKRLRYWDAAQV